MIGHFVLKITDSDTDNDRGERALEPAAIDAGLREQSRLKASDGCTSSGYISSASVRGYSVRAPYEQCRVLLYQLSSRLRQVSTRIRVNLASTLGTE